jgi:hypothetical protein
MFGPFYHESGVTTGGQRLPDSSHGLISEGLDWPVVVLLAAFAFLLAGIGTGAVRGFRSPGRAPVLLLRSSTAVLALLAGATFVAIGGLFGPAALLAIVSALATTAESPTNSGRNGLLNPEQRA